MNEEVLIQKSMEMLQVNRVKEAIRFLREENCSKVQSISILQKAMKTSGSILGDAKLLVHFSQTWNDRRETDDSFHDSFDHLDD